MKKRIIAFLMAAMFVLSASACSAKTEDNDVKASVSVDKDQKEDKKEDKKDDTKTDVKDESKDDTKDEAKDESKADAKEFSLGKVVDGVYVDEYFNVKITPAEGMTFATDEQIEALSMSTARLIGDNNEKIATAINDGSVVTTMYLSDLSGLKTVNVNISGAGIDSPAITPELIIDAAIPDIQSMLTNSGFTNVTCERSTTEFLGETVACLNVKGEFSGLTLYEKQVELIKGGYISSITVVSYNEDATADLLALVSNID